MNERIKELAEQCYNLPNTPEALYYRKFDEQKFAELIVGECFDVVIADGRFHDAKGIIRAGKGVAMEHFGVK